MPCLARLTLLLIFMVGSSCNDPTVSTNTPSLTTHRPIVFASNYPLAYCAERLLGSAAQVISVPTDAGDPAFWQPDDAALQKIQAAQLILLNGADYEKWAPTATLPQDRTIRCAESFRERWIVIDEALVHSHGQEGEHSHAGTAFTTWIDFDQARQQLSAVRQAIAQQTWVPTAELTKRWSALDSELAALDQRLLALIPEGQTSPALIASHPVYQYLARRYRLSIRALHWEPDTEPADEGWKALETLLAAQPSRWLLWEDQPLEDVIKRLDQRGLTSVVFAPCGNKPDHGDFLTVMQANVTALENLLRTHR